MYDSYVEDIVSAHRLANGAFGPLQPNVRSSDTPDTRRQSVELSEARWIRPPFVIAKPECSLGEGKQTMFLYPAIG